MDTSLRTRAPLPLALAPMDMEVGVSGQVSAMGKFLFVENEKFYIKGISYGTFAESAPGVSFPEPGVVRRDFELMRQANINTIRLYTLPPAWLLDLAAEHGLRAMIGVPWPQHLVLRTRSDHAAVLSEVTDNVRQTAGHPAVLAYLVGNEIPSPIVRWYGKAKTQKLIAELYDAAKQVSPQTLVSYANYPSTEYLELPFLDFHAFNVYLHRQREFHAYLAKLQTLAGDKPLVISEFGLDSLRHSTAAQARMLEWQAREIFDSGCAGLVAFSWTDDWFRGGHPVEDWAFGLVDRERHRKPAYHTVAKVFSRAPFLSEDWPRVTVVVAAFNAASTLDDCLGALVAMRYPDYEVVVVDDGSTDDSGRIADRYAAEYPQVRVIHVANGGLSVARNLGISEAAGQIIAYTDADCRVDRDWLFYVASKLMHGNLAAVGGPNLVPPDDGPIAQCVARSPGGPTHILVSDELAEHIPGCNMAFWKQALEEVKGFDPVYRVAGDDVDLCWRLQANGQRIGFAPGALVWHHRRDSIKAYLKQQIGYGRAEAFLERQHPEMFNSLGQVRWSGRIYGPPKFFTFGHGPRIYQGVFGTAPFQSLYHPTPGLWAYLPQMPEWYALIALLVLLAAVEPWLALVAFGLVGLTVLYAVRAGMMADLPRNIPVKSHLQQRGLIVLLHLLQPPVRAWGRIQGGLGPFRLTKKTGNGDASEKLTWRDVRRVLRPFGCCEAAFWSENGQELDGFLRHLMSLLYQKRMALSTNSGWERWDFRVEQPSGVCAHVISTVEEHGGPKRLLRLRVETDTRASGLMVWAALTALAAWSLRNEWLPAPADQSLDILALSLPIFWLVWIAARRVLLAAHILASTEQAAKDLGLVRVVES